MFDLTGDRADQPLAHHLARLARFLSGSGLRWNRVGLVDEPLPGDETQLDAVALTLDEFQPMWEGIVAAGARDWVNLHAVGVRDDELLVAVEHFSEPLGARPVPLDNISVNLSGPSSGYVWIGHE